MRSFRHIALTRSLPARMVIMLLLGVGYACGVAASSFVPDLYCGVVAPCEDAGSHTDAHAHDSAHAHDHDAAAGQEDDCCPEDDCCEQDCPECFFCYSGPLVLLDELTTARPLPAVSTVIPWAEHTLFLPSPPIHQPPRFEKYPQV